MSQHDTYADNAFELLSWTTPAQFHFVIDRYNDFVEIADDCDERAKFWKVLEDDWSSVWHFNPEIMQKLKNYYYTMRRVNTERGLLQAATDLPRHSLPIQSQSRSSSLTSISQSRDTNVDEPSGHTYVWNPTQSTSSQSHHCQRSFVNSAALIVRDRANASRSDATSSADNSLLVDVPGFAPSEIRTVFVAGDLLVHAERAATKGKRKENGFNDFSQGQSQLSTYMETKIELPAGVQAADIRATLDVGRLTIQFPNQSTRRMPIVVEDLDKNDEDYTNEE